MSDSPLVAPLDFHPPFVFRRAAPNFVVLVTLILINASPKDLRVGEVVDLFTEFLMVKSDQRSKL